MKSHLPTARLPTANLVYPGFFKNGIQYDHITEQYHNRRHGDPARTEYLAGVKLGGVISTAAGHENKSNYNNHYTSYHDLVVHFIKCKAFFFVTHLVLFLIM